MLDEIVLMEDRVEERRVGVGEGISPVEGERRIFTAGSSNAAGLYQYFNPAYDMYEVDSCYHCWWQ